MPNAIAIDTMMKMSDKRAIAAENKRLKAHMAESVARFVEVLIARDFQRGGKDMPQREIAEALGITQSVLSQIRNRKGSVGVLTVAALRRYSGTPMDEILGNPLQIITTVAPIADPARLDAIEAKLLELQSDLAKRSGKTPGPRSKAGIQLEELRKERRRVAGQEHLDRQAAEKHSSPPRAPAKKQEAS